MTKPKPTNYFFLLGGVDNEMEEIKKILIRRKIPFLQPERNWGSIVVNPSQIPSEFKTSIFVFVECNPAPDFREKLVLIDHHGSLNQKPASLLQVCKLLKITPNQKQKIIASIDSDFLAKTIEKYPDKRSFIIKLWKDGYKNKFSSPQEWKEFKRHCTRLWREAKSTQLIGEKMAVVYDAPPSMTMIGALANLEGWACILICGPEDTSSQVPVFFQGDLNIVKYLSGLNLAKSYYGKNYFGCRCEPREFVQLIKQQL